MLYANNRDIDITYMLYLFLPLIECLQLRTKGKDGKKTKQKTNQNKNKQTNKQTKQSYTI